MSKKILVTGGAGFIGSHLCEKLLENDYNVICVDSFNDYYDPRIKGDNIADSLKNKNFTLVKGDILDKECLDSIFFEYDIHKVVHLAAIAGVSSSLINPQEYIDVDIKGTVNLLEIVKKYKVDQFIFGSSSSVYGINYKIPFAEEDRIDLQISPYATAKRAGELYCSTYHHLYGVPITILIGNSKTIKLRKLIELIAQRLNTDVKIQQFPERAGDVYITYADISRAKRILGYEPLTSIEEGIDNFVKWYLKKRNFLEELEKGDL